MERKRIVVACGTGIATSTVVAEKVSLACKKHGINAVIVQCKVAELAAYVDGTDLIVATTPVAAKVNVPVVKGIAFLTGIGEEVVIQQIMDALKQ